MRLLLIPERRGSGWVLGVGGWDFKNVNKGVSKSAYLVICIYLPVVFQESKIDEHHFVAVALKKPDGSRRQDVRF